MKDVTAPLREEHRTLLPHVEQLRTAAEGVDTLPVEQVREQVDEALRFLQHHLLPHAQAEEAALYPAVEDVMEAPGATATMSRDHVEVLRLVDELAAVRAGLTGTVLDRTQVQALQRLLYGLLAVVVLHFAKEEEVYLPLLDAGMSPMRAHQMFERMERAASQAAGTAADAHAHA